MKFLYSDKPLFKGSRKNSVRYFKAFKKFIESELNSEKLKYSLLELGCFSFFNVKNHKD